MSQSRSSDPEFVQFILRTPFEFNYGAGPVLTTVRGYLKELLRTIWLEGEGFSGKRPFGDSSWYYDISNALIRAKVFEDGEYSDPPDDYDKIILACIDAL